MLQAFIAEELEEEAYSGLYIEHDPETHFVLLVQEAYDLGEMTERLSEYAGHEDSDATFAVRLKSAVHSFAKLNAILDELNESYEQLSTGPRPVQVISLNEKENYIEIHVSTREDLNEELIDEITGGDETIIVITEGLWPRLMKMEFDNRTTYYWSYR